MSEQLPGTTKVQKNCNFSIFYDRFMIYPWVIINSEYEMFQIYLLRCSICKRISFDSCYCKINKTRRTKEKNTKGVELNLDRNCGVFSPSTNTFCQRSLKCKTHSIHLKRAVKGRSKPFDILLSEAKLSDKTESSENITEIVNSMAFNYEPFEFEFPLAELILKQTISCKRQINM